MTNGNIYKHFVKNLSTTEMLVGHTLLTFNRIDDAFHALGITPSVVWRMYGENISYEQIIREVQDYFEEVPRDIQIRADVDAAFEKFVETGLFIESEESVELPEPSPPRQSPTPKLAKYDGMKFASYDRDWIEKNHPGDYFELVRYLGDIWSPET